MKDLLYLHVHGDLHKKMKSEEMMKAECFYTFKKGTRSLWVNDRTNVYVEQSSQF